MRILSVTAHPDDMETGFGGTLKRLVDAGHDIVSLVTTLTTDESVRKVREEESRKSHALIGLEPTFWKLEELNPVMTAEVRREFGELVKSYQPDLVFTHWPVDVNPDHRLLSALTIEPFLQKGVNTELFAFEVFSIGPRPQNLAFYPTHYVDITDVLETKEKMVRCMTSQDADALWAGNLEMQETRAFEMTSPTVMNAEAFVRITRYGDLHPELAQIMRPTRYMLPAGMGIKVVPERIGLSVSA